MSTQETLIFFCGKMGAGKSTYAKNLHDQLRGVLLCEDDWLAALYPEEIHDFGDYIKYSSRLKPIIKKHVQSILNAGVSVIMDFPANTLRQRAWFKEIIDEYHFPYRLIYLNVSDAMCLKHIKQRRDKYPERAQFDTEDVFYQVSQYFEVPKKQEGLTIETVNRDDD